MTTLITPNIASGVDHGRMERERLARLQEQLRRDQIGAALLFDPLNVRYATTDGEFTVYSLHVSYRWALVPAEGAPVLWEASETLSRSPRDLGYEAVPAKYFTFFETGSASEEQSKRMADELFGRLRDMGLAEERIGIDRLEASGFLALVKTGLNLVDVQPSIETARAVKTQDELMILRENAALCDGALADMRQVIVPGCTENDAWGTFMGSALRRGALYGDTRLLSSGKRSWPSLGEASDHPIADGELVGIDTDLVAKHGYFMDVSRTYVCGDRPTDHQRRLYQTAHSFLMDAIPEFRAGASIEELASKLGDRFPREHYKERYPFIAHGSGMADEWPTINWANNDPGELLPGMVFSVESQVTTDEPGDLVKLEEQIVVTDGAPEILCSAPYDELLLR